MFYEWLYYYSNIIGLLGVIVVLIAYIYLQLGWLKSHDFSFSLMNFLGSTFILISLYFYWNFASVVIESAWCVISLFGVVKAWYYPQQAIKKTSLK